MIRKVSDTDEPTSASGDVSGEGPSRQDAAEEGRLPGEPASEGAEPPPGEPAGGGGGGPDEGGASDPGLARPLPLRVEAVLFASGQAVAPARLAKVLGADLGEVKAALDELAARWRERETAIDLVEIAGGWRFMTRPAFQPDLLGLARKGRVEHLSPAALETLAVVAYRQPIGRADIEAVRGVQSGPLLRVLLDRDLIRIVGRSKEPGHPLLYGTTRRFLDHFGLKSLKQLPDIKDLLDVS